MTKDEALKLALEALENSRTTHYYCEDTWYSCPKHEDGCANEHRGDECDCGADEANQKIDTAIATIKEALAQPAQGPVAHTVIAGALFDFMGCLTSLKERIVLSAADDAAPAADAIRDFATKRGLSLDDAQVREWIDALAQPEERNFCPRCGKRTADLTTIHTCTPPQIDQNNKGVTWTQKHNQAPQLFAAMPSNILPPQENT
jgi:hypothetical protein